MKQKMTGVVRAGAAALIIAILTGMYAAGCGMPAEKKTEILLAEPEEESPSSEGQSEDGQNAADAAVHVCGAVERAGVYRLPLGSRVIDAVECAGGMTADADPDRLNLAEYVKDGEQIRIPYLDEEPEEGDSPPGDSRVNINTASKEELMSLPGIGESRAEDILAWRSKSRFEKPEDIMNVPGIKEGAFRKLEGRIRTK